MRPIRNLTGLLLAVFILLTMIQACLAQTNGRYNAIYSGVPWLDDRGNVVSAHGANIIKNNGRYYLYGEAHSDTSNAFAGFNCYSSADLYNWKFESVALPVQKSGKLGPNRVGERVKVLKCPKTGEYIMLMHTDTLGYRDPCICYATSATPAGPYVFRGPLLFNGKPITKWDMGTFQDNDGSGYLLVHGGNIFKLSDNYKSVTEQVFKDMSPDCESPAVFKKGGLYYWLASSRTSWERNDNFYYTATSLKGPWTLRGNFAPKGTLTWDSQTTFVLPIAGTTDTTYLFMGDRWSFPRQASSATYVWQPLSVEGTTLAIPKYQQAWQINTLTGVATESVSDGTIVDKNRITYQDNWHTVKLSDTLSAQGSDTKSASFSVKFNGKRIGLYLFATPKGGYGSVTIRDGKGRTIATSTIDTYCKYPTSALKFISPVLAKGNYTLTLTVLGAHASWSDKRRSDYGSTGDLILIDKIAIDQ